MGKALELGLSLHGIRGTGPGGRITQAAIDAGDSAMLRRQFMLADRFFRDSAPDLKNAFYVSYLEDLDFSASERLPTSGVRRPITSLKVAAPPNSMVSARNPSIALVSLACGTSRNLT